MSGPTIADPTVGLDSEAKPAAHALTVPALIFDTTEDQHSIINLVAGELRRAMMDVPVAFYDWTEEELRKRCKPTHVDNCLRVAFWREFDRAMSAGEKRIQTQHVFGGICSEQYFYGRFLKNPKKVAWLVRPIQNYKSHMEAILVRGTQRLEELVNMDVMGKDGKVDVRRAELLLKVVQEVGNRVKGLAVQKIRNDSRTLRVNVNAPAAPVAAVPQPSLQDLKAKLMKLEGKKPDAPSLPQGSQAGVTVDAVVVEDHPLPGPQREREIVTVGVVRRPVVDSGGESDLQPDAVEGRDP